MICQLCSTPNGEEADYCASCGQKLLVVSGAYSETDQDAFDANPDEQLSFDEHLLERISILEEVVRRTAQTVRQSLGTLYKLEQKILVNETGLTALRDLLEARRVIDHQEWSELWEARMDHQLLALEKRERFGALKERIAELYSGPRRESFHELLDQAELALLGLDIDQAMEVLEEAHELDPANHELSFFLGETYFNEGRTAEALSYFSRVLAGKPRHFESLVYTGVLSHEQGLGGRAEELLKRAVALYPESFLPAFSLGAVYASRGNLQQAAVFLERALDGAQASGADGEALPAGEADGGHGLPQASYLLGSCYFEMGKLGPAIEYLRAAVRQDPSLREAHHLLGLAYLDRGWTRKALASFRLARRLQPDRLEYQEWVELLGSPAGQLSGLHDDAVQWLQRAEDALREGQTRLALTAYRRAVGHDPENPGLLLGYAMACLELQRIEEIEPTIDRVLDMGPGEHLEATAYATLIEALRAEGRLREGDRLGEDLLERFEGSFARAVAYYELACNQVEAGEDLDLALDYARRAVDTAPDELLRFPLDILGWVHLERRELEPAVDCLTRSNDLGSSPRSLLHLGIALLSAGESGSAREALARARQLEDRHGGLKVTVLEALQAGARLLQESALADPRAREPLG